MRTDTSCEPSGLLSAAPRKIGPLTDFSDALYLGEFEIRPYSAG